MKDREAGQRQLRRVQRQLTAWREQHGGRGRPIPTQLWEQAVAVARAEGVEATARALGVDRHRLARLAEPVAAGPEFLTAADEPASAEFVELDGGVLCSGGQTVVHLEGGDGDRVRIEVNGVPGVDVIALAHAFWRRGQCCS